MKISQLMKELELIKAEYGDLLIQVCVAGPGDEFLWGDLNYLEVEERTTLNLCYSPSIGTGLFRPDPIRE